MDKIICTYFTVTGELYPDWFEQSLEKPSLGRAFLVISCGKHHLLDIPVTSNEIGHY